MRAAMLAAFVTGAAVGCGSTPPRDQYYGTNVGADFVAPVVDASASGGSDGAGADVGAGGAAGAPAAGEGGAAGTGVTDLAGADGAAGAAGTGS